MYVGYTEDLKVHYNQHDNKEVTSTKDFAPLELIHYEAYWNMKDAKSHKSYKK